MTVSLFVFVILSTSCSVMGQLALKRGMLGIAGETEDAAPSLVMRMVFSPWVVGGLFTYGLGVLFWLVALSRLDVSYLYPFASLSYVGVTLGSYFFFSEHINRMRLAGITIIILGVIVAGLTV
ncbi:MAG: EamA family transporter [Chloroflexi bacterium]|nr:EamA family transporter [Chloroflexota bacterium]